MRRFKPRPSRSGHRKQLVPARAPTLPSTRPTRIDQINATMTQQARDGRPASDGAGARAARIGAIMKRSRPRLAHRDFVVTRTVLAVLAGVFWGVSAFDWMSRSAASPLRVLMLLLAAVGPGGVAAFEVLQGPVAAVASRLGRIEHEADRQRPAQGSRRGRCHRRPPCPAPRHRNAGSMAWSPAPSRAAARGSDRSSSKPRNFSASTITISREKKGARPFMRKDYHIGPGPSRRTKSPPAFRKMWARYIGPCEALYTRNPQGRQTLLKARAQSVSTAFHRRTDRTRTWR